METLFILLHSHHWRDETKTVDWTIGIPVYVAVMIFLLNLLREYIIKRRDTKKLLSNQLIETCDKMIRLTIAFETSIVGCRYHANLAVLANNDTTKKEEMEFSNYYHKKAEELYLRYELLKSDLRKNIKDLKNYWGNENEVKNMISIMSQISLTIKKEYEAAFTDEEKQSGMALYGKYHQIRRDLTYEVMFNGVGFELSRIQRIIDPTSPSLYLSEELEKELLNKITAVH